MGRPQTGSRLDELLPRYDFNERHHRVVAAPPLRVDQALEAVTLAEMPLVPLLFAVRSLPARLAGRQSLPRARDEPLLAQFLAAGFTLLVEDPGRELAVGVVAQMWERGGRTARIRDAAEFTSFDHPGFVKVAMNFRLVEQHGGTRVETETRVLATDAASRRGSSATGASSARSVARSGAAGCAPSRGEPNKPPDHRPWTVSRKRCTGWWRPACPAPSCTWRILTARRGS